MEGRTSPPKLICSVCGFEISKRLLRCSLCKKRIIPLGVLFLCGVLLSFFYFAIFRFVFFILKDKIQLYPMLILLSAFILPSVPLFLGLLRGNSMAWRVLMFLELILLPVAGYYTFKAMGDGEFQKVITFPLILIIIFVTHSTPVKLWCRISGTVRM